MKIPFDLKSAAIGASLIAVTIASVGVIFGIFGNPVILGTSGDYGDSPNDTWPPANPEAKFFEFGKKTGMALIYLKFDGATQPKLNVKSVRLKRNTTKPACYDNANRLNFANLALFELRNTKIIDLKTAGDELNDSCYEVAYFSNNFADLRFSVQYDIYTALDNDIISFSKINTIKFTEYDGLNSQIMSKNYSFYGARYKNFNTAVCGGNTTGFCSSNPDYSRILYFEHWATDQRGLPINPITAQQRRYSMNIHTDFQYGTSPTPIPIIIDPEVGNGGGHDN